MPKAAQKSVKKQLGFPWILSSESNVFNWVREDFCEKKFRAFLRIEAPFAGARWARFILSFALHSLLERPLVLCLRIFFGKAEQ